MLRGFSTVWRWSRIVPENISTLNCNAVVTEVETSGGVIGLRHRATRREVPGSIFPSDLIVPYPFCSRGVHSACNRNEDLGQDDNPVPFYLCHDKVRMEAPHSISPCESPLLVTGNIYLREVGSVGGYWIELASVTS